MRAFASLIAMLVLAPPLLAQEAELERPSDWTVRTDRPDQNPEDVYFVEMPPGWHITTGPAAILYHPETTAAGSFRVETETFLFDPKGRREAFGLFVGGTELEEAGQSYVYFMIRDGGQFLIKRRSGAETSTIADWRGNAAILSYADREEDATSVKNVLAVDVGPLAIRFLVNGTEVAQLPKDELGVNGVVGLRVNHGLNLHVTRLDVTAGGGGES